MIQAALDKATAAKEYGLISASRDLREQIEADEKTQPRKGGDENCPVAHAGTNPPKAESSARSAVISNAPGTVQPRSGAREWWIVTHHWGDTKEIENLVKVFDTKKEAQDWIEDRNYPTSFAIKHIREVKEKTK